MTHIDACDRTFQDLKVLQSSYKELVKDLGDIFDCHVHAKIKNFIEEMEKNLNLTMNSQAEMTGTLKNLKIWMKAQSTSLTKNANELKNYLHQQEKLENNATYVPPPPNIEIQLKNLSKLMKIGTRQVLLLSTTH